MRETIIAGNWKMYKTVPEARAFLDELLPLVKGTQRTVVLAVPYTAIAPCAELAKGSGVAIGAQNMNDASEGAFTGEIAARMLVDAGATFVVLGHSERRHIFGESSAFVNKKVKQALKEGLRPIVCVGETLEERQGGRTEAVLERELLKSLAGVTKKQLAKVIVAYEPVWAIGTGHTATPEMAEQVHTFLRKVLDEKWSDSSGSVPILYGGSVKPDNAHQLLAAEDVDGLLVGGASLTAESFYQICKG
ncbi:MAG: triose-phosphate isomerase [Parachlamydiales bacterium]